MCCVILVVPTENSKSNKINVGENDYSYTTYFVTNTLVTYNNMHVYVHSKIHI